MDQNDVGRGPSRRDALRKGSAFGLATGIAWTAPKVYGLSLRPEYAAATSAPNGHANFSVQLAVSSSSMYAFIASVTPSDRVSSVTASANPATWTLTVSGSQVDQCDLATITATGLGVAIGPASGSNLGSNAREFFGPVNAVPRFGDAQITGSIACD